MVFKAHCYGSILNITCRESVAVEIAWIIFVSPSPQTSLVKALEAELLYKKKKHAAGFSSSDWTRKKANHFASVQQPRGTVYFSTRSSLNHNVTPPKWNPWGAGNIEYSIG